MEVVAEQRRPESSRLPCLAGWLLMKRIRLSSGEAALSGRTHATRRTPGPARSHKREVRRETPGHSWLSTDWRVETSATFPLSFILLSPLDPQQVQDPPAHPSASFPEQSLCPLSARIGPRGVQREFPHIYAGDHVLVRFPTLVASAFCSYPQRTISTLTPSLCIQTTLPLLVYLI